MGEGLRVGDWQGRGAGRMRRQSRAEGHGHAYVVVADGFRYIQHEYFPDSTELFQQDITKVVDSVFGNAFCEEHHTDRPAVVRDLRWAVVLLLCLTALLLCLLLLICCFRSLGNSKSRGDTIRSNDQLEESQRLSPHR